MPKNPTTIRIFISSPGDVAEERTLTRKVIERLQGEYSGRVELEPIYWEHEPLRATASFPEEITRPSETDIVITILWSRLGTRLPAKFKKQDGSRYESGTEYEFEDAFLSFKKHGTPDLLIYRKTADPKVSLKDKKTLLDKLKQKEALDSFFDRWFHDSVEGTLVAAFHPFENSADFEEIFESHLSKLIKMRLPEAADKETFPAVKPVWKEGSPFRGLSVFNFEHSPVFFGRTKAVSEIIDALRIQSAAEKAFILVLGMSGGGKSSLVRAGVLPMITQPGVIEGVGLWRRAIMKPGDSLGDLFDGLAASLLQQHALPELSTDGTGIKELAKILRETPKAAVPLIKGGLSQAASEIAKSEKLAEQPSARLVLVVDQMEEMFSLESITQEERIKFIEAIDALSHSGRVWVIATLRSDFYPRTAELEGLVALKEGNGQYDLLTPTPAEIGQMIRQPAQAAGLYFEEDTSTNERLDDVLRDAASKNPGALPLLEFTLEELYKQRMENGMLTYEAYKKLGGVEGALAQRAEEVLAALDAKVRKAMDVELHSLISIGVDDTDRISRKYAPLDMVTATPETKAFVDAFVDARLFTTDLAADGSAVVSIAHEALLQHWPRLQDWVEKNRENLRVHARVNAASRRWKNENKSREFLWSAGKQVNEAEELVKNKNVELTDTEKSFIRASIAKRKRVWWIKRGIAAALVVLTLVASGTAYLAQKERDKAKTEAKTAEQVSEFLVGIFEVSDPSEALGDTITAREILDKGAEKIEKELVDQPEVQARLMKTMGDVYVNLGLYEKAKPLYENAININREIFGNISIEVSNVLNSKAILHNYNDELFVAESLYIQCINITVKLLGNNDTLFAERIENLGNLKLSMGQYNEADSLFNIALQIFDLHFDENNPNHLHILNSMAHLKSIQDDWEGAKYIQQKIVRISENVLGEKHIDYITYLNQLALTYRYLGELTYADSIYRKIVPLIREIYSDKHPIYATSLNNLGLFLYDKGEYDKAEKFWLEALAIRREIYNDNHSHVSLSLSNLGVLYREKGDYIKADKLLKEALDLDRKIHGDEHPELAYSLYAYAMLYKKKGDYAQAEKLFYDALIIRQNKLPENHSSLSMTMMNYGICLVKLKRYQEAEYYLLESYLILNTIFGEEHEHSKKSLESIIELYKAWNKPEKAAEYELLLPDTIATSETQ